MVTFGTIMAPRNHPDRPRPLPEIYQEYISDAVYLEQLGFGFAWIGEHRMTPCQWTPSPLTMAAAIAAQTSVLRVGTSVLCLPFHNPLRVAEDIAVIDNMSDGRFDFGFGVGSHWDEFQTFGVPISRRWSITMESAQLIERCLIEPEPLDHHGEFFAFAGGSLPDPAVAEVTREMIRRGDTGGFAPPVVGTPDEAYELLAPLVTTPGITHLPLSFRHAGMRTPEVRQSMDLFAAEVLPALQALVTTPAGTR